MKRRACRYSASVCALRLLDGFAGNGRRFRHGSLASGRFSVGVVRCWDCRPGETSALCGVSGRFRLRNRPEVANGGLRAARAGQQTLRSGPDSRGARGEAGAKGRALRGRSHEREQGTEVCSFPNAPPSPVHVRLQSCIAPACASGAWRLSCGGGRPSSCRLLSLGGGKALRNRRVARLRAKKRRWTLSHAACVCLVVEEKCRL